MAVFEYRKSVAVVIALVACSGLARAADEQALRILHREMLKDPIEPVDAARPGQSLRLTLAVMRGTEWRKERILESTQRAMRILAQCGIGPVSIELIEFDGPARYRTLFTPVSRKLAAELGLPRPTVFFVEGTRNRPAFDAEAVGRSNSRTRPEMADTVWIVQGTRDLDLVIAHELVHVLADSGEHSDDAGNLMRDETAPGNTKLTPSQCGRIARTASENGLLRPRP